MYQSTTLKRALLIAATAFSFATIAAPAHAQRGEDNARHHWGSGYDDDGCTEYRLSSSHGEGGIRLMSNQPDFRRVNNANLVGEFCAHGRQEIEIAKRDRDTQVTLSINGHMYEFRRGDEGDKLEDNWYRYYVKVDMGNHSGSHGYPDDGWAEHSGSSHSNHHSNCAEYRLSASGGEAGVRIMRNQNDFHSANNRTIDGRFCADGRVTVELSKRDRNTHARLELNGRVYEFRSGDEGDKLEDHWYRRYFEVNLGRYSSDGGSHGGGWGSHDHDSNHGHHSGCAEYWLSSSGGDAGIRLVSNQDDFHSTHGGRIDGRFCADRDRQRVELSKRDINTSVTAKINGRRYEFRRGDDGDKLEHNWYRRYFDINLSD